MSDARTVFSQWEINQVKRFGCCLDNECILANHVCPIGKKIVALGFCDRKVDDKCRGKIE